MNTWFIDTLSMCDVFNIMLIKRYICITNVNLIIILPQNAKSLELHIKLK